MEHKFLGNSQSKNINHAGQNIVHEVVVAKKGGDIVRSKTYKTKARAENARGRMAINSDEHIWPTREVLK